MSKLIGIDVGTKRVGIALSDDGGHLAFPYKVLPQNKELAKKIKNICVSEGVDTVIIGESLNFNQRENPIMSLVRALKSRLEESGLSVYLEPEVLTTQEARRPPAKQKKNRKPTKREIVDARAAALILQSYINKTKNAKRKT